MFQRNQKRKPDMALEYERTIGRTSTLCTGKHVCGRCLQVQICFDLGLQPRYAASADDKYLESQLRLFCGMSHPESQHAPALSQYRNIVSDRVPAHEGNPFQMVSIFFIVFFFFFRLRRRQKRRPYAKRRTMDICKCRGGVVIRPSMQR
jgi:hypothetical protein